MTQKGLELLRAELHELKTVLRPRITAAIAEARSHGDLKENGEYHAARDQQGLSEARIRHLEAALAQAQCIDVTLLANDGKVIFGATVCICNVETEQKVTYQIVSEEEANLAGGKISSTSPIARGLIGKQKGDEVIVKIPNGETVYEIIRVDYL